jgi:hypothetical protein
LEIEPFDKKNQGNLMEYQILSDKITFLQEKKESSIEKSLPVLVS